MADEAANENTNQQSEEGKEQQQQAPQQQQSQSRSAEDRLAQYEREIERLKSENANNRVQAKAEAKAKENTDSQLKQMARQFAKAAGFDLGDEDEIDPVELQTQLADAKEQSRLDRLSLAIYRNPGDADPDRLMDSRKFQELVADVDPSDTEAVKAVIKEAVKAYPYLKAEATKPKAAKSGTEFAGQDGSKKPTVEEFRKMSGFERNQLFLNDQATYQDLASKS